MLLRQRERQQNTIASYTFNYTDLGIEWLYERDEEEENNVVQKKKTDTTMNDTHNITTYNVMLIEEPFLLIIKMNEW